MGNDNAFAELQRRGFIQQVTDPEALQHLMTDEKVVFYVGIDPTADSLHAGHLVAIMGMAHMQRFGHRPIAILGGGTAMVGDPSGKTEMRKMLTRQQIQSNGEKIKQQLSRFLQFGEDQALLIDNYEWLGNINYIEFLRDIGRHFSVNRMLTFETYKRRMETGLSFLEFNYQLLQAFDFLKLYELHECRLQMGGDDQWANILAGTDLIRRVKSVDAYGLTFPLLTTATGTKMGKTEKGAVWLDAEKTSPYEYYQYWVNADDRDVQKFLSFFTVMPMDEIDAVAELQGADLNTAKTILAFETTKLNHGQEKAEKALSAAMAAFGGREIPKDLLPSSSIPRGKSKAAEDHIPSANINRSVLRQQPKLIDLLNDLGMAKSKGEARRLVQQGGVYVNDKRVADVDFNLAENLIENGKIVLRMGKKRYLQLVVV